MTTLQIIEVAAGAALFAFAILSYRRGSTQGAVLLMAVAALILIHGLGLMEYRPSPAEMGR
jgi:hypothetical protein